MESRSVPPPPLVLGVLGGVASGKSAAARFLAGEAGWTVSADAIVQELLDSPELVEWISGALGSDVIGPDGRVDRARVAALVFDPERGDAARRALEGWTHPRVRARILARVEEARRQGVPRVVLDVPLLLETDADQGLARLCHALVFVDVRDETRDRRGQELRGWPPGEVARREAAQLPLDQKRARADHVISNETTLDDLRRACRRVLAELAAASARAPDPHDP